MKYPLIIKGSLAGLLMSVCVLNANAQKIEEDQLKVNVSKITNSTQQLKNLEPVTYKYDVGNYKYLKLPSGSQYGFLASNVQPEFPDMVYENSKVYNASKNVSKVAKYTDVQLESLIPVMVAAIKEQQAEIERLKQEINLLKEKSK